ncbi:hypothetical protein D3C71_1686010 [compost metagenome]
MYDAIKDSVRNRWVSKQVVPFLFRILAGNQQRAVLRLLIYDIEKERTKLRINSTDTKIINDQELGPDQLAAKFRERVIRVGEGYFFE